MKPGDLVRMRARSIESVYGTGLVVKRVLDQEGFLLGLRVFWSKYGLGNRVNPHSLELISEGR